MAQECRRWRDFNCVRYMQRLHGVVFMILHSLVEKSGKDILIESMFVEKCPVTGGALTLPDRTFFAKSYVSEEFQNFIQFSSSGAAGLLVCFSYCDYGNDGFFFRDGK